jgi:hypothetical protein
MKDFPSPELKPETNVRPKTTKTGQKVKFRLSSANEALSQPRTDTRTNCTSETHKKEVKRVKVVFRPVWKILVEVR